MDLSNLFAAGEATIELKHPVTGKVLMDSSKTPKALSLTVIGTHTKKYKEIVRKIGFAARKKNSGTKIDDMTFDEFNAAVDANDIADTEVIAESITACNIVMDGKKVECTKENMLAILSDERMSWIKAQYLEEIAAGKLFYQG